MVAVTALWLPILLSAVFVFIASSVIHMVIKWHKSDYGQIPGEEAVMEVMRKHGVKPGNYFIPHCKEFSELKSPEVMKKFEAGPVGLFNVMPSGPPSMGKQLVMWFVYTVIVSVFAAYLAGRHLPAGADYLSVFRIAAASTFMAYGLAETVSSIWKAQKWGATVRHMIDGLIYSLLTGGTFGWLWPS